MCQHFDGSAEMASWKSMKCLPSVGVALPIDGPEENPEERPNGNVFCFLPLPIQEISPTGSMTFLSVSEKESFFGFEVERLFLCYRLFLLSFIHFLCSRQLNMKEM